MKNKPPIHLPINPSTTHPSIHHPSINPSTTHPWIHPALPTSQVQCCVGPQEQNYTIPALMGDMLVGETWKPLIVS